MVLLHHVVLTFMKEEGADTIGGVMHCFTETWEVAREALDLGFHISLSGIVTFKSAESLREVARKMPLDRLLIETDAPYLAPVPHRGKRCEPAFVADTARFIAALRGEDADELIAATTRTAREFFRGLD
jgi:TatD DNase family protein